MFDVANREMGTLIGEDLPAELLRDDPFGEPADEVLEAAYADAASPLELRPARCWPTFSPWSTSTPSPGMNN